MAKSYLATALAQNVVPGLDTPDNRRPPAVDHIFKQVLAKKPHDVNSMKQIAGIYFSIKQLDEAKDWQKKVLYEDKNDAEAAYTEALSTGHRRTRTRSRCCCRTSFNDDGEGNVKVPEEDYGASQG